MSERAPDFKKKKLSIAIVETSATAEARARDIAEDTLNKEVAETKGVRGFLAKIWKNNLAYDYYHQKALGEAREKINKDGGNLYADRGDDRTAHEEAMRAVVAQFTDEHAEHTVHEIAGEKRSVLGESVEEKGLRDKIKSLVMKYAAKDLGNQQVLEAFKMERKKIIEDQVAVKKTDALDEKVGNRQRMFADNLLDVARSVQESIRHGEALSELDLDFEVVVGRARAGVRTEAQLDKVDRLVEKMQSSRMVEGLKKSVIGPWVNETTIAGSIAVAYLIGAGLSKRIASSRAAAIGTFGATALLAGGFAWGKERRRMEKDRALHARQRAEGKEKPEAGQKRREEIEESRYETISAGELSFTLNEHIQLLKHEKPEGMTPEARFKQIRDAYIPLNDIEFRIEQSDRDRIDLIHFSDATKVVEERCELDVLRTTLKTEIQKIMKAEPEVAKLFEAEEKTLLGEVLGKKTALEEHVERKDRLFSKLKEKKAFRAAIKAASIGLVIGATAQEGVSLLRDDQRGIVEGLIERVRTGHSVTPPEHVTGLEWIRMKAFAEDSYVQDGGPVKQWIGSNRIAMPDGFALESTLQPGPGGGIIETYTLQRNGISVASGLTVDSAGLFTPESHAILKANNLALSVPEDKMAPGLPALVAAVTPAGPAHPMSASDYLSSRSSEMQTIKRVLWYDNNTPAPKFDKNELRLWQGGVNDTGVDKNGNYAYSVRALMEKGSYHGKHHINARELMRGGKLKLLLSLTKGTQNQVFEVPIDAKGNAIIDPRSEAGRTLFSTVNGKMQYMGGFAEVAHTVGTKDGIEQVRILATEVGRNEPMLPYVPQPPAPIIEETPPIQWTETRLQTGEPIGDLPPIIPIMGRRPLEENRRRWIDTRIDTIADPAIDAPPFIPIAEREPLNKQVTPGYGYGYETYGGAGDLGLLERTDEVYNAHLLEQFRGNPGLDFSKDDSVLVETYLNRQEPAYRNELRELVKSAPAMPQSTKVVFAVPAYKEQDNIYKTLRTYAKMPNKDEFEIVVFENHPKDAIRDRTGAEIERFMNDYPDVHVVHLYKAFDKKEPIGLIRKYLNDAVLERKQQAGRNDSVILVSNDADLEDINPNYASRLTSAFESNQTLDAINGKDDFPAEAYKAFPLLHALARLQKYFEIGIRRNYRRVPELIGRNAAMRSSVYAAIGGYNPNARVAEDLEMGWLIRHARGWNDNRRVAYLNDAWIKTNPRRALDTLQDGARLSNQYRDFHSNEKVRDLSVQERLRNGEDFSLDEFVHEVQAIYDTEVAKLQSRGQWLPDKDFNKSFDRAMRFLGVKYRIENDRVIIDDVSKLVAGLEKYKQKN
ncbi:MAG: hypothetical protein UY70_C0021G0019 [Candidatus Kaiserbacteria bacterium GW2011_GWB1_52_6]|uniref:Uncharacterized protein n=2 Tax=Candidatus Kaiseribacteriota TaxID=1752734 RepID=A0A0G2A384_9BACT|nr:MAG: hypothetical protein UY67_C0015G0019 [Candidatus Kaiserbacteria bacterium GW2011_GWA2_52_12]KKW26619.1 MAG: hypothetical protein UY70_C0021G0019 [Candidatus Kaiserbacteria bacterium GW2011_GWB1_52_6]